MLKRTIIFFFFLFFVSGLFWAPRALAALNYDVSGYAWSSTIGWISFNSLNCDADRDNIGDANGACPTGVFIPDYGVSLDIETNNLWGYAWSSNVGWVSFNSADVASCPNAPDCQPRLVESSCSGGFCDIEGWARVLAHGAGWEGWIRLADTNYQVYLDSNTIPVEFYDWAWSDAVAGWISFNCKNQVSCAVSDYQVRIGNFNREPIASIACNPASCSVYRGESLTLLNRSTDPDSTNCPSPCNNDIVRSEWDIFSWGSDPDLSCANVCDYTVQTQLLGSGNYNVELYVRDAGDLFDTVVLSGGFEVLTDVQADFSCSLDNVVWEDCEDMSELPELGQDIYFLDNSTPSQGAASIVSRRWWVVGETDPFNEGGTNPSLRIDSVSTDVRLWVQDSAGRTDTVTYTIGARLPIPEWIEVHAD